MNLGETIFSQLMKHVPLYEFKKCVTRYNENFGVRTFSCWDQFACMAFAQLSYRESLRDIECCLRAMQNKLYHMGIRGKIARNTLAYANENRDWRIYADFAQVHIHTARNLYLDEPFGVDLKETVYAMDASTIDLCLSVFPWARFRKRKGGVKLHTLLDLRGPIPTFISITDAKVNDIKILDQLILEPGSIYIFDRGYLDFERLYRITQDSAFFVIRAKSNLQFRRLYSHPIDKSTGLKYDQTVILKNYYAAKNYPDKLRLVKFFDPETQKSLCFLSNNFSLPPLTITKLYKCRWQVELFFKWIKQHLRIKKFYGTSENAVKTQIWIAISMYVLVALVKKRLKIDASLYTILQVLSVSLFEKNVLNQLFLDTSSQNFKHTDSKQLNLFNI